MIFSKNLILIGFMATGKTSIGQALASKLNMDYIDTDEEIEKTEGNISLIFKNKGEEYFRQLESTILQGIINKGPMVISTGGGIVLLTQNREILKEHIVILLTASIDEIYERVKNNDKRPLLNNDGDRLTKIKELYSKREGLYQQLADMIIHTDKKNIESIVHEIISKIETYKI